MTQILRITYLFIATALVTFLLAATVAAQKPNKPNTVKKPATSQKQKSADMDRDQDRDRDRDRDKDMDQDKDRDRDRVSRPMSAEDRDAAMRMMMQNENHVMASGYKQNMLNFAQSLRLQLERGSAGTKFSQNAVKEIKRNFKEMEKRHKSHMQEMSVEQRVQMQELIREMEEHHERIRNAMRVLEMDAKAKPVNAQQMLMHTKQLEEQLRMRESITNDEGSR